MIIAHNHEDRNFQWMFKVISYGQTNTPSAGQTIDSHTTNRWLEIQTDKQAYKKLSGEFFADGHAPRLPLPQILKCFYLKFCPLVSTSLNALIIIPHYVLYENIPWPSLAGFCLGDCWSQGQALKVLLNSEEALEAKQAASIIKR